MATVWTSSVQPSGTVNIQWVTWKSMATVWTSSVQPSGTVTIQWVTWKCSVGVSTPSLLCEKMFRTRLKITIKTRT